MGLLTFKGGVHLAKDKAIVELLPQGDLVYPLSQHIGAPAKPVVAKGDHVLKGQKIAEAGGFVSAPIYASVSGTVKAIEQRVNPTGSKVNSIIIANDGQYEEDKRRDSEYHWRGWRSRYGWSRFPYQSEAFTKRARQD